MNNRLYFENLVFYYYISHLEARDLMTLCLIPLSISLPEISSDREDRKKLLYGLYLYLEEVFEEDAQNFDFKPLFSEEEDAVLELQIRPHHSDKKQTSELVRERLVKLVA
jgi:hypothetical protein